MVQRQEDQGSAARLAESVRAASPVWWQELGILAVLLLVCALTLSKNQPDPDFWGHVQYGREMLAEGLPTTITHSYTTTLHPWINHEILSELLLAVGIRHIGPTGLLGLKCLLGVAVVGTLAGWAARRGTSLLAIAVIALMVAVNLMHFWLLRPQLMSYLCFTALLFLLTACFRNGPSEKRLCPGVSALGTAMERTRWLWLAPLLLVVWTNSHGGFVAGYAVLVLYLSVRGVEAYVAHGRAALPLIGRFAMVVAASGLATLLNPYGFRLHAWLLDSLSSSRPEIIEWRAPELLHVAWLPWWLLVALFVSSLWRNARRVGYAELAVLLVVLWQAVEHRRNIPFFAIAFGVWMPTCVDTMFSRWRGRRASSGAARASLLARGGFVAGLVAVCLVVAGMLHAQFREMPVNRSVYPVSAFQYMADRNLDGKLVLRFMWAQYAIAALGDPSGGDEGMRVAFDGRFRTCYPQEIVDMYFDFALGDHPTEPRYRSPQSPPIDGGRILDYGRPDLVLVDRQQPHPVQLLQSRRGRWVLLYQDQLAQLWGRATKYSDPTSPDYLAPDQRYITDDEQTGFVPWPALPVSDRPDAFNMRT